MPRRPLADAQVDLRQETSSPPRSPAPQHPFLVSEILPQPRSPPANQAPRRRPRDLRLMHLLLSERPEDRVCEIGVSALEGEDLKEMFAMREKAIETKDERAVGGIVFLNLLVSRGMEKEGKAKKFGEKVIKQQLLREFERPIAELEAAATKAEEDLQNWLRDIKRMVVGGMQKEARKKDLIAQGRFSEAEPFFKSMDDMPETLQQMMHLMVNSCANGVGRPGNTEAQDQEAVEKILKASGCWEMDDAKVEEQD